MAVPTFQFITLPLLEQIADGKVHALRDVIESLASHFKLTDEERREMLPSQSQTTFHNRASWARTYLKKAGLLDTPKRAMVQITQRGLDVLKERPERVDVRYLKRFPEFLEFQTASKDRGAVEEVVETDASRTPEEIIESGYEQVRNTLAQELLPKVRSLSWMDFERLVVQLLVRMGYGGSVKDAGRALAKSGDEGIDGMIKEDKLGLGIIYIQAKKWQAGNSVGRPELQKFVGALAGQGATKGIFITTSFFTKEALDYRPRNNTTVVLIDGEELTQLMIDHGLGVTPQRTYIVKRIDSGFFGEE